MAKHIDAEKLKAEIERLKSQLIQGACAAQIQMETNCKDEAYNEMLAIVNSLQKQEQPSESLEEAAEKYCEKINHRQTTIITDSFIAGAEWQKAQMMKEAVEGEVENSSFGIVYLRKNLMNEGYSTGDKVRIIIVKEDKK